MTTPNHAIAIAAIQTIETAGERLASAVAEVQRLEDERPLVKAEAIRDLIGTPNPNGKQGAVHSASSAEDVVEIHAKYWNHRVAQRDAEVEKHRAFAQYEAAKLLAKLAVDRASVDPTGGISK